VAVAWREMLYGKRDLVIAQQKAMLVIYNTTDEDDAKLGVGLGCNGIIQTKKGIIASGYSNTFGVPVFLRASILRNSQI